MGGPCRGACGEGGPKLGPRMDCHAGGGVGLAFPPQAMHFCWRRWGGHSGRDLLRSSGHGLSSAAAPWACDVQGWGLVGSTPHPPPLYKLRPCPSYSRRRDRNNCVRTFHCVQNVVRPHETWVCRHICQLHGAMNTCNMPHARQFDFQEFEVAQAQTSP